MRQLFARIGLVFIVSFALSLGNSPPASAQIIHLPPAYRRVLAKDAIILTITPDKDGTSPKTIISVDDDQIIVQRGGKVTNVALGDRQIKDVMNELMADFHDLEVTSNYPLYPAYYVGPLAAFVLPTGTPSAMNANGDQPNLAIGFGVVLSLAEPTSSVEQSAQGGILTQTGFQLDVVGTYQMVGPPPSSAGLARRWFPVLFTQWRLGLNADQQIQTGDSEVPNGESQTQVQLEQALGQADQIALSGQVDIEFPPAGGRMNFVLTPSVAVNWTRLQSPPFPDVLVQGKRTPAEEFFSAAALERARVGWAQILPLNEFGIMATLQHRRHDLPLYYVGAGVMSREILIPGVRYVRVLDEAGRPGDPDPESLEGTLTRQNVPVWRAALGARLAEVFDLRVDASASIGEKRVDPLLRVLLARAFPIGQ